MYNKSIRLTLGILLALLALNAFGGGIYGMIGATGVPLELLEGSPFKNYFFPSIILFVAVGGSALLASMAVFAKHRLAKRIVLASVFIVLSWLAVQVAIIGYVSWMQPLTAMVSVVNVILVCSLRQSPSHVFVL